LQSKLAWTKWLRAKKSAHNPDAQGSSLSPNFSGCKIGFYRSGL